MDRSSLAQSYNVQNSSSRDNFTRLIIRSHPVRSVVILSAVIILALVLLAIVANASHRSLKPYSLAVLLAPVSSPVQVHTGIVHATTDKLPSPKAMLSLLKSQGVSLEVDGSKVSLDRIALHTLGFDYNDISTAAQNATKDGLDIAKAMTEVSSPTIGLPQAVALLALDQLLLEKAQADGIMATTSEAKSLAQKNYNITMSLPPSRRPPVPPGMSREQQFFSSAVIQGYRNMLTENKMIDIIAGSANVTSPTGQRLFHDEAGQSQASKNRTPALQAWMNSQLKTHSVVVTTVPGVNGKNISTYLPPDL